MSSVFDEVMAAFTAAADAIAPPHRANWKPLPHQIPPQLRPDKLGWLLMGGRGTGKTETASHYVHDHVHGPPCLPDVPGGHWISIVAPTLGDTVTSCVNGVSGLRKWDPGIRTRQVAGGLECVWSNGATAKLFGASTPEDAERFRAGGNRCLAWFEELAAMRYAQDAYDQVAFGLRVGPFPHWIASTTPRAKPLIKQLVKDAADGIIAITYGTTDDNPHLDARMKAALYRKYGNTRLGLQELQGKLLEDVERALWKYETIERWRVGELEIPDVFDRVIVAVDPAKSDDEKSDLTGIIVLGMVRAWNNPLAGSVGALSHGFVLEDLSDHLTPKEWAERAIYAYNRHRADLIVAEINMGGQMVEHTIRTIDDTVPTKSITATRGKKLRAEPVASLWQQGRGHHVGYFPELEEELTTWDPTNPDEFSPNRMDALVYAATEAMIGRTRVKNTQAKDRRLRGRR